MDWKLKFCALVSVIFSAGDAQAGLLDDAWGVVTDPFKIGKGTENIVNGVENAMIHLERVQKQFGEDADRILGKVDKTIAETRKDVFKAIDETGKVARSVTDNAVLQLSRLEKTMVQDAGDLIKCSTQTTLFQIQTTMAESLNQLGERKPRLEIFGWTILSAKIDPVDITNPMQTFRKIRAIYQAKLDAIGPDSHPHDITDIYGEMQRLADLSRCHYKADTGLFEELYWTEINYNRMERPWRGQVQL